MAARVGIVAITGCSGSAEAVSEPVKPNHRLSMRGPPRSSKIQSESRLYGCGISLWGLLRRDDLQGVALVIHFLGWQRFYPLALSMASHASMALWRNTRIVTT